jgi:hypothetical protein
LAVSPCMAGTAVLGCLKIEGIDFVQADIAQDERTAVGGYGGPVPAIASGLNSREVGQPLSLMILNTNAVYGWF